ncbi:TetR/AcrR family transcriptional regulator [Lacticaseibacillus zeae]|uniref:TetR/AcrR family transcriptional regulator n=1 Tax=Lacticaseibacillus zeae TaxID=57037 RepID=A0A5R8LQ69_LACZE|nr:TetR/AcrR family transcriptional regulator [Lacticaseibacillus zeae]TLF39323.1 TetR/AcrR family transcriptional regulator [Lacticaseibacillus zeae]
MQPHNLTDLFSSSLAESQLSAKQQAVLKASLSLFSEKGFDRTSTKDIAHLAGVSEGTVYKQFKTKESIRQALLAPLIQQVIPSAFTEFIHEIGEQHLPDLHTFLTFIVHNRMAFAIANQAQLRILAATLLQDAALSHALAEKFQKQFMDKAIHLLAVYQQEGALVDWPLTRILRYIFGTILSYLLPVVLGMQSSFDLETAVSEAVAFLERGLQA